VMAGRTMIEMRRCCIYSNQMTKSLHIQLIVLPRLLHTSFAPTKMAIISLLSVEQKRNIRIHFEVTIDRTATVFTGGFNTTIALLYEHDASWSLVYANNLKNASQECDTCRQRGEDGELTSSGHPKPKPKPHPVADTNSSIPKPPPPPPPPKPATDGGSGGDDDDSVSTTTFSVTMTDSAGDGWFKSSGFGAMYSISSADRSQLLATGTLCSGMSSDTCEVSLQDGSYVFRAAAAMDEDAGEVSWEFCEVAGGSDMELSFYIQEGVCYPLLLLHRSTICASSVSTTVTMTGVMVLEGVDSLPLSATDIQILSLALSDILPTAIFNITSSTLLLSTNNAPLPRLLSMFTSSSSMRVAVEFELSVVAEDFGFDGRRYDDLTALLSVIDSLLSTAFSVGTYDASICIAVAARLRQRVVLFSANFVPLVLSNLMLMQMHGRFEDIRRDVRVDLCVDLKKRFGLDLNS